MAGRGEFNPSFSMDEERSEGEEGAGQWTAGRGEDGAGQEMAGRGENNSSESIETMDQNCDTTTLEDFANRPSKKSKCLQSNVQDDQFPSPTISSSLLSECPDSISSESDNKIDDETLPSSPSPTKISESVSEDYDKKIVNSVTYDYLPQDYTLTELDLCAHSVIQYAKEDDILVISAYICCLKEQAHVQNQHDVYYENPFVTRLLKQDGQSGIDGPTGMTKVVKKYLNHDMVHLPINIKDSHWYLASVNFEKCDIQVLDSLCWEHNRADLTYMLQGLQYHLDILKSEENSIDPKWKDIDFTKWTITEQLQKPIQKDSSSCGLFMLKFMEYWTGHTLSHTITQEIITSFRYKLAAILLCWKNNKAPPTTTVEESDYSEGDPNDIIISDSPFDENQSKELNSLAVENKYKSMMSVLSNLSLHELVGGLRNHIKSINSAEILEKVWVQSSDPYPISLTLKKLQEMLNEELTMDFHCFNFVIRKIMFDNIQTVKKRRVDIKSLS